MRYSVDLLGGRKVVLLGSIIVAALIRSLYLILGDLRACLQIIFY